METFKNIHAWLRKQWTAVWSGSLKIIEELTSAILQVTSALMWIAKSAWGWVALLFIVTALWSFGGLVASIALAESIPSAVELSIADTLLIAGALMLALKICVAAWQTQELKTVQRVTISFFVIALAGATSTFGSKYLIAKIPTATVDDVMLRPPSPEPPDIADPTNEPPRPKATRLVPSMDLLYSAHPAAFNFINRGPNNIHIWGSAYDSKGIFKDKGLNKPITLNANGGSYHIYVPNFEETIRALNPGKDVDMRIPFQSYISMDDGIKRIINYSLWVRVTNGVLTVDTQEIDVKIADFTKP